MPHLYEWTHADVVARDEVLQHKQLYLNMPFFLVRAALYFVVWNALSYFLNAWSLEQDRTGDPRLARRMQMLSGGGLLAYGLTITFASFDWLMSLEPHWFSTIYGVLIMGGQGAVGAGVPDRRARLAQPPAAARAHRRAGALPRSRQPDARVRDAVGVLLVLAVPDHLVGQPAGGDRLVPAPAADRLARRSALTLVLFHFAVPFVLLLSRRGQARAASCWSRSRSAILVVRLVDLFWLIAPEFHQRRASSVSWLDVVLPLSLGVDLARLLRLAAARPRDSAGARSAVRRSARPHHRARRAAEDGALAWPNCIVRITAQRRTDRPTTPRSITRRATSTSARSSGSAPASSSSAIVVHVRDLACCFGYFDSARGAARAARVSARRRAGRRACRRSRGCRPTRARTCSELRAQRRRAARAATAGSTGTPASSGFRSTRRCELTLRARAAGARQASRTR